ncbi:UNVERIFIED_CONTAM: hypothetical protein NCL1_32659 [Trichonephila clavipes]
MAGYRDIYEQLTTRPSSQNLSLTLCCQKKSIEIAPSSDEKISLLYYNQQKPYYFPEAWEAFSYSLNFVADLSDMVESSV